jgi:tRNA modification GTPase
MKYLESLGIPFLTVVNKKDLANADFREQLESEVGSLKSEVGTQRSEVGGSNDDDQTSNLVPHTSYLVPQTSNLVPHTSSLIFISARNNEGIEELKSEILRKVNLHSINTDDVLISNIRHLEALQKTEESLNRVLINIDNPITSDFLASDIKQALYYLGEITGKVTTDDLLETIFSKFCIGK